MRFLRLFFKPDSLTDNIGNACATLLMVYATSLRILLHSSKKKAMVTDSKLAVTHSLGQLTLLSGGKDKFISSIWALGVVRNLYGWRKNLNFNI